jgi:regulator of cell morphogenesis and NO signaling
MKEISFDNSTVGEIVALDYRAASVFRNAGIDFCCGGSKSLIEACSEKNVDPANIKRELVTLQLQPDNGTHKYNEWDPGFLCDYLVNTHHQYVLKSLPVLVMYTRKIADVHGDRHPELKQVADIFLQVNNELLQHLRNEEEVLFPAVKRLLKGSDSMQEAVIEKEIRRMSGEHELAGGAMDRINDITLNYYVPADGCNTYFVTYKLLKEFEDDLHTHVHLENNILYPKALKLK